MRTAIILALTLICGPVSAAEMTLKCEDLRPRYSALKTMRMQPVRRGKAWLSGVPESELLVTCDRYGMKTGEFQYSRKSLVLRHKMVYQDRKTARLFCENAESNDELTSGFSQDARASLEDFCRKQKKKDFDAVLVYDETAGAAGNRSEPFKHIFRVYNGAGFVSEEYFFDPASGFETKKVYSYDAKNNLTEAAEIDFSGTQIKRETFSFDKITASKTHSVYRQTNELLEKTVSQYREDSTLRSITIYSYDAGAQLVSKSEIRCSAAGLQEKEVIYRGDFEKPAYEYHYSHKLDPKGNWAERRKTKFIFFNGKYFPDTQSHPEITRREITYYDLPAAAGTP